jgi:hypothetical protein
MPFSDAGIDAPDAGARIEMPSCRYRLIFVANARSTEATVPVASTHRRLAGPAVIFKPWPRSHVETWAVSATDGEKPARNCAGVR